jgi:cytochrome c biogenesis protein CcdA
VTTVVLGFVAGSLSVLSPCVLPVLPVIVASALHRHAQGPLALAAGLVASSTTVGLLFASFGFAIGLDRDVARAASGALMAIVGVLFVIPTLHERFQAMLARAISPLANRADRAMGRLPATLLGQFVLGILLGAVWVPCTGPTLAAAITLAGRGENIGRASTVMIAFGLGAVVPVLMLAYGSRRVVITRGHALGTISRVGAPAMGVALLLIGVLTVTGIDKRVETTMVDHMPQWLLNLTTRF